MIRLKPGRSNCGHDSPGGIIMEEYKMQDEVLDGLMDHVVNNKSLIDQPCRNGHEDDEWW
jgi:hypothetical protein